MIKHLSKITAVAAFAVIAASASAEVKLNENFSVDGYAIGSAVVTEGTNARNDKIGNSSNNYDSVKVALNGKYDAFTSKVSLYGIHSESQPLFGDTISDVGVLDAYVTYTTGKFAVTGGKFLSALGYESFDSPNNDFISFSSATYSAPYATGAKVEYTEAKQYMAGVAVRDSQMAGTTHFFEGDGSYANDIGYEAYFKYIAIEKLEVFVGTGYQEVNFDNGRQNQSLNTYDVWASYLITDKLKLAAEYASVEDSVDYSWNVIASYAFTADFSGAVRVTGSEGFQGTNDTFGYGVASTYTLHKNFALKAEVTKTENNLAGQSDVFSYALQGVLKF